MKGGFPQSPLPALEHRSPPSCKESLSAPIVQWPVNRFQSLTQNLECFSHVELPVTHRQGNGAAFSEVPHGAAQKFLGLRLVATTP